MSQEKPRPLAALLIFQILLVMVPLLVISAWGVYFAMRISYRNQNLEVLRKVNQDRVRVEISVFQMIESTHKILGDAYKAAFKKYQQSNPRPDFLRIFEQFPDGSWRTKLKNFDGERESGTYIGSHRPSLYQMRAALAAREVTNHFGPAFLPNFVDTFLVDREQMITLYWPEFPAWVHSIGAGFDLKAEQYYQISSPLDNPSRQMALTDLYLDKVSGEWLVSAVTPVEENGVQLTSVGHDLHMIEVINRADSESYPGTENMIIRMDGRIVVSNLAKPMMQALGRSVTIGEMQNPVLTEIFEHIKSMSGRQIVEELSDSSYMIAARMGNTNWVYVTHVGGRALDNTPIWMRNFSLIQSLLVVLLLLGGIVLVLRRRVLTPLTQMLKITQMIGEGNYKWSKPVFRDLETNQMIDAMKRMTDAIEDRDRRLLAYSNHLESLVEERTQQIKQEQARLIQAAKMATLGEMAGSIAHEINNPLASIELSAVSLQRKMKAQNADVTQLESLEGIQKMTARMAKIVKGLKRYSRDSSKDPKEPAQVRSIVEDSVLLCQAKLTQSKVTLSLLFKVPEGLTVMCRPVEISQVLVNLIGNSVDAVAKFHDRWIRIEVELENNGSGICIRVTDSGPRIPADVAKKLMEPFFTTKPPGQGTGLGLSISKSLVESHGGQLRLVENSATTSFEVHLPVF